MRELQDIAKSLYEARLAGERTVLATVVSVEGSSYRKPGAMMLVRADDRAVGSVSGGCLEADVITRARDLVHPTVVRYDTTADHDLVQGVGLGCQGTIDVLLEPLEFGNDGKAAWLENGVRFPSAIVTVVRTEGQVDTRAGSALRIVFDEHGIETAIHGMLGDLSVTAAAIDAARESLFKRRASLRRLELAKGRVELSTVPLLPPPSLFVLGAGNDAQPLVTLAKNVGWRVSVVDHRPAYLTGPRFAEADTLHLCRPEALNETVPVPDGALAAVMTHNYAHDLALLGQLLDRPLAYLGLLGPKKRTLRLLADVEAAGTEVKGEHLDKLYAPMGLDLGAEAPEAIAVAAVAEMQAVLSGRDAGFLRDKRGGIHDT